MGVGGPEERGGSQCQGTLAQGHDSIQPLGLTPFFCCAANVCTANWASGSLVAL